MPLIALDVIEDQTRNALVRHGAGEWQASEVAKAVRLAEARGNRICGLYYLESYCQQLVSGRVKGKADPVITNPKPATVRVDARFGFAQPAFMKAIPEALDAAQINGIASLAVSHAHTCTSLGYFTEAIARKGLIGIGFTNATPIVAAPGGSKRLIGTNPFAASVPDGSGGIAMQFDFSTSAVALGKITMAKAAGEKIPLGWAVDADGKPTSDPEAALAGALVSAGGHKGWGLGLLVEVLAAGMTGGLNSVDVAPLKAPEGAPHDLGQFYILIDPEGSPDFANRFNTLSEAVAEDDAARLPGASLANPAKVEVSDAVWALVGRLAG